MNHRIVFINSNGEEETLAEFTFSGDMVAFFTSTHFQKEYADSSPKMQRWECLIQIGNHLVSHEDLRSW